MTAFTAGGAVSAAFAQGGDDEAAAADKAALYKKYTENYKGTTVEQRKMALEAAKQYIEKYPADETQVNYYKKALPSLEEWIRNEETKAGFKKISDRYDASYKAGNYDETFAAGKDFLAKNPDLVDVMIDLGSIGFAESIKPTPNTKYNADSINYAKQAIAKLESNAKTDNYGFFSSYGDYARSDANKNDKFPGRDNALGNLNYKIAYLMYFNQNMKKEAIPYFYKASKYDSSIKTTPLIYTAIADSYFEEAKRLNTESEALAKAAGDKDTDESKAKDALAKGYADRAIDAYSRAYKYASASAGVKKEYKDGLYKLLQELFKFRFSGKIDGLDAYVSTVMNKPFVDPSTAVVPVIEETPATAATTSGATTSSLSGTSNANMSATTTTTTATKIGAGSTTPATKTAASTATTVKPATPAKTKAPVKKPAAKKKGTR